MRIVIRVPAMVWSETRRHLLGTSDERMAYLLGHASVWRDPWERTTTDLLVRCAVAIPDSALVFQTGVRVEVDPAFTGTVLRECYEYALSLVDLHTHPFTDQRVRFSPHDEANMLATHAEFAETIPQAPPALAASFVLGQRSVAGAWRDPSTGSLAPVDELRLFGRSDTAVALAR